MTGFPALLAAGFRVHAAKAYTRGDMRRGDTYAALAADMAAIDTEPPAPPTAGAPAGPTTPRGGPVVGPANAEASV